MRATATVFISPGNPGGTRSRATGSGEIISNVFDASNQLDGVLIDSQSLSSTIGGTSQAARNLISANYGDGVHITDAGTSGNEILGDYR